MDFSILFTWDGIFYLIILSLLEIVLGIDNIIFITIITDKVEVSKQKTARNIGLILALVIRLILLTVVSWVMSMTGVISTFGFDWVFFGHPFTGQSLVLFLGGLFLIYKSTIEMHKSVKGEDEVVSAKAKGVASVILQIVLVDIVFSFDSVITAIGMTNELEKSTGHSPMVIIYIAVIVSMIVMMLFAGPISRFINNRPTIKMIALAFLVSIGVILIAESFGEHVPKGYIYFAMLYALGVEFLNIKMRRNKKVGE